MNHSFSVEIATEVGIEKAILLENLAYWIKKNIANEKNFYDGYCWTYNSTRAFSEMFPYMSSKKISRLLIELENDLYIKSGNYNKSSYDRTKWFTITNSTIAQYYQMDVSILSNQFPNIEQPIPYINTDINYTFSSGEEKDILSKQENKLIKNIEEEKTTSLQEKENQAKEVAADAEKIFKFWNNRKQLDKHWLGVRKFDDKVKAILVKILKTYSKEDIELGMSNYIKEIKSRKGDSGSYKDHRFTLHKFFTQSNGFVEYYNKII